MTRPDYRGARGSNAGDDFHELWAVRQALELLNPGTNLRAITLEGLTSGDESESPSDTWDGVDCAFYFGGDNLESVNNIVIDQLKYSAANPNQSWTVARLTHTTNIKQDNSVIGRLAKVFEGIKELHPDLVTKGQLSLRLISNQSVDPAVFVAFSNKGQPDAGNEFSIKYQENHASLIKSSNLNEDEFKLFSDILDLSGGGKESRSALEESILITISSWTDEDARSALNDLMRYVRLKMMPEGKGEFITRQSLLSVFGFSDLGALYPCDSAIHTPNHIIFRESSRTVTEEMINGSQRICIHGEAGCGKTTALQEIESLLPAGSCVIKYDCYGEGRYLDSDAYRHRPEDAFLQLSNDLARQLRIPFLLTRSKDLDYPKAFKKRLEKAAQIIAVRNQKALLVIVVDAADNSITAANMQVPLERSFLQDFLALGDLPPNVRFAVTTRTGRLETLNLPLSFMKIEIKGFTPVETAKHVQETWADASDTWLADFHYFSGGNPRVQHYALQYAGPRPEQALNYLRPNGKDLGQIFQEQLSQLRLKVGNNYDIKKFCSGLIALPRPIPITALAAITELSAAHIHDLNNDLAPGTRIDNGMIGFADEDFEHFIRTEAEAQLDTIQNRIADYFAGRHQSDVYAATHLASALLAAGRRREIIDMIISDLEPHVIVDPVLRKNVQLQRLRIAMKVCREAGNNADAMLVLLRGAEAQKTDNAIHRMLVENPDLTASFARHTAAPAILRNSNDLEKHGPLLFHIMAADAQDGNAVSVREEHRQIRAWLSRRKDYYDDQQQKHPNVRPQGWSIEDFDIAAETEAILRINGAKHSLAGLLRWHPKAIAVRVAKIVSHKLLISGEESLLEKALTDSGIVSPWDLFLLTPLALAGRNVELFRIELGLERLLRRDMVSLDHLRDSWTRKDTAAEFIDTVLTACEVIIARGGDRKSVLPILERIVDKEWRRRDKLYTSDIARIDLGLRAFSILERLAGRKPTLETYWIDPPTLPKDSKTREANQLIRSDNEKKEELKSFIGPLIEIYDVRAQSLMGLFPTDQVHSYIEKAIAQYHGQDYRYSRSPYSTRMSARVALSLTYLLTIPGLDRNILLKNVTEVLGPASLTYSKYQVEALSSLALSHDLHPEILRQITTRIQDTKNMKISAEEKMNELLLLSRALVPISYHDAESLFNDALKVAGDIDVETMHEIRLFSPLAEHAVPSMSIDHKKAVAQGLAIIISDAGVRLAGYDHFPWEEAGRALALLNMPVALAAVARWEDQNVIDRYSMLPTVLETALSHHELTPAHVAALSPLVDEFSEELMVQIADHAILPGNSSDLRTLAEYLARDELIRFSKGSREIVAHKLHAILGEGSTSYWTDRLIRNVAFHQTAELLKPPVSIADEKPQHSNKRKPGYGDLLAEINWGAQRFVTVGDIESVISLLFGVAEQTGRSISISTILDHIRSSVLPRDQFEYLEALSHSESVYLKDYEIAQEIVKCLTNWHASPSVTRWRSERLLHIVADNLPGFSRWISFGEDHLRPLLMMLNLPKDQISTALLEAIEHHVDEFDSPTLYALVGVVSQYCTSEETAQVLDRFGKQLIQRIDISEREKWDLADIPNKIPEGIARFLYALMGDIDVRIRWRAIHALRRIVHLGCTDILDQVIGLYNNTSEQSYRRPDAPFYWLAARLWLMIALDRIAGETPLAIMPYHAWLYSIANDNGFPHLLVRMFAKSALIRLLEGQDIILDKPQLIALNRTNVSHLRRKKKMREFSIDFDRYEPKENEDRRFHFNSMDTLPYWYAPAFRVFADVKSREFLETAERWIVDNWGVKDDPWRWIDEPRMSRLTDDLSPLTHNDHGSRPVIERFHTYLEWHAMWCATGELMQTRALAKIEADDFDPFEDWLNDDGLSVPPWWLADFHGTKPLEDQLWSRPHRDVNSWVDAVGKEQFLAELALNSDDGFITVGSNKDARSRTFHQSIRVLTALVRPETGASLIRALQTVKDSWDYAIPSAGDGNEINNPPYSLTGWLVNGESKSGIDREDPLRYGVSGIERGPSREICNILNLTFNFGDRVKWIDSISGNTVFVYDAWGDNRGDEREDRFRYDELIRSYGWQLRIDKEALTTLLNTLDADMIVEIEIVRGNEGYDYSRHDEEKTKKSKFDKVILLRKDGTVEAAEGRLGTWKTLGT